MAQDQYIKNLMSNYRLPNGASTPTANNGKGVETNHRPKEKSFYKRDDISRMLQQVRELHIDGDKKRLIKLDNKNEDILKVLNPVFSVDVTRFINFVLSRYFEEHPELIQEIKNTFKEL